MNPPRFTCPNVLLNNWKGWIQQCTGTGGPEWRFIDDDKLSKSGFTQKFKK